MKEKRFFLSSSFALTLSSILQAVSFKIPNGIRENVKMFFFQTFMFCCWDLSFSRDDGAAFSPALTVPMSVCTYTFYFVFPLDFSHFFRQVTAICSSAIACFGFGAIPVIFFLSGLKISLNQCHQKLNFFRRKRLTPHLG